MNEPGADFLRHMRRRTGNFPSFLVLPTMVLIIASLYWAQTILIPIALSILLTFLLSPVIGGLERLGLRRVPSVILIVVLTFSLLATIGWITTVQFTSLAKELPKYQGNIKQKIADVRAAGKGGNLEQVQKTVEEIKGEICPARDGADEVALLMFQQLLHSTRYDVEVIAEEKLASEVVAEVAEKNTGLVCIAAIQPGGLDQSRYLCKRLRSQFPDVKIAVGLWGFQNNLEENRNSLLSAGADEVSTNLVETRDQITNLGQRLSNLNNTAPDGLTAKSAATLSRPEDEG